ncbi:MAG: dual specificity protein phosphatase family protein [Phototrophicaceae bacterium]
MNNLAKINVLLHRFWDQLSTQGLRMTLWAGTDTILRTITGKPVRRLSEITPKIFIGGQPADSFWSELADWGVSGVVNMRGEYDYSAIVNPMNLPLKWIHLPTVDTNAPSLLHLEQGVDFIKKIIRETDQGVYIHCWEGLGRGPTMAAAYFVSEGLSPDEAWDKIRQKRPFIRPTEEQQAQLVAFQAHYKENVAPQPPVITSTS